MSKWSARVAGWNVVSERWYDQMTSTDASSASTSGPQTGLPNNKSVAAPDAILAHLVWLGKRASIMTEWERSFLFDCTGLVDTGEQLSNKQVAEIKHLRVKYVGR